MRVGVVTVGDELLVGDTVNTNAAWLGEQLTARGATVVRMVTIPDDVEVIAEEVRRLAAACDAVVVTGGLGPTHDDRTMAGVGAAFDRDVVEHPAAATWFEEQSGYSADDLAPGTTQLPVDARFLPNETGVAPGVVVENVYVLPGVPEEMQSMFEAVADEFGGQRQYVEVVRTTEPESSLVDRIEAVRTRFDVSVGSYPGEYVRLKLEAPDESEVGAAASWLREQVEPVQDTE